MAENALLLKELDAAAIPQQLKAGYYFDFEEHPFAHSDLFAGKNDKSIIDAIGDISTYAKQWLADTIGSVSGDFQKKTEADYPGHSTGKFEILIEQGAAFEPAFIWGVEDNTSINRLLVAKGAKVFGANIFLNEGSSAIGEGTIIEPGVGVKGSTIIGRENEIRQGAYFRGGVITGDNCTLRGEMKNTVLMDKAAFPHPCYLGDSLCGYATHFGNQATSANLGLFAVISRDPIVVEIDDKKYNLERSKIGIVMGDYSQVGCNSVSDPGTFLAPWTLVYPLSRLNRGFYGPYELIKNKPMERGVLERLPLQRN